jgi:DNA polymerase-4
VAVSGDRTRRQGIIMARNMLAKYSGVNTGESTVSALEKCPGLIVLPPSRKTYIDYAYDTFLQYTEYSDYVQMVTDDDACDEACIDVTKIARDEQDGRQIAHEIRAKMKERLAITCSVGVSDNIIFAKIASDLRKPDSCTVITRDTYQDIIWKLPSDKLWGVNKPTKRILEYAKIYTIGDIANAPAGLLEKLFGKFGGYMHRYANGEDTSPVKHKDYVRPNKSLGSNETTPRDMETIDDVKRVVYMRSEIVASKLRRHHLKCRTVKLTIRENDLKYYDRQGKLEMPTFVSGQIAEKAMEIFQTRYNFTKPLRSIGVRACDLIPENEAIQTNLFFDMERYEKEERLERTIDNIRAVHGYDIIHHALIYADRDLTYVPPEYDRSLFLAGGWL